MYLIQNCGSVSCGTDKFSNTPPRRNSYARVRFRGRGSGIRVHSGGSGPPRALNGRAAYIVFKKIILAIRPGCLATKAQRYKEIYAFLFVPSCLGGKVIPKLFSSAL